MRAMGAIVGLGFLTASGFMNFEFGYGSGRTTIEAWVYGLVGVLAVFCNGLCPFFLAWHTKRQVLQAGIVLLWVVCLSYSLSSAIGFAAENREGRIGPREAQRANYELTLASLADLEAQRGRSKKKWRYDKRIEALREEVKKQRAAGTSQTADPQGQVLAALMFVGTDGVRLVLNIIFGVLVEVGAALVLYASVAREPVKVKAALWRPQKRY